MSAESSMHEAEVGDELEDGTILAGYYEGKALYTTPEEAPLSYSFKQAVEYAAHFQAHRHSDWRIPTAGELKVLFANHGAIGSALDVSGSKVIDRYWSSSGEVHGVLQWDRTSKYEIFEGRDAFTGKPWCEANLRLVRS